MAYLNVTSITQLVQVPGKTVMGLIHIQFYSAILGFMIGYNDIDMRVVIITGSVISLLWALIIVQ